MNRGTEALEADEPERALGHFEAALEATRADPHAGEEATIIIAAVEAEAGVGEDDQLDNEDGDDSEAGQGNVRGSMPIVR